MNEYSRRANEIAKQFGITDTVDEALLEFNISKGMLKELSETAIRHSHSETRETYHKIRLERAQNELEELSKERESLQKLIKQELIQVMIKHGSKAAAIDYSISKVQEVIDEEHRFKRYTEEMGVLQELHKAKDDSGKNAS